MSSDIEVQADTVEPEPAAEDEVATALATSEQTDSVLETDTEPESSNAEAAKWRKQFREAEQQRDLLADKVTALQKQQVEQTIVLSGVKPAAVWAVNQLADLLAEDGTVSTELVAAAVQTARDRLGIQPVGKGTVVPGIGTTPSALPANDRWSEAFKPHRSR